MASPRRPVVLVQAKWQKSDSGMVQPVAGGIEKVAGMSQLLAFLQKLGPEQVLWKKSNVGKVQPVAGDTEKHWRQMERVILDNH